MAIKSIQYNLNTYKNPSFKKEGYKSYLDANEIINTENKIHPAPPEGHLVNDTLNNSIKYYFKDIGYALDSVKAGFNGTANDHQLGRLNNVGMVAAGVLIATYLASKTNNPKTRLMEYVGLGAFLTAMSLYPKLAINTPAKIVHGYDIDKEYIDDQGRKKSVMQNPNYVPYDMYLASVPEEDISVIGDRMGIPRDIVNRNDVIKEQMRKIATQNNTLWMLTACVTPALAGLLCYGIENYIAEPLVEKSKLANANTNISKMLQKTINMANSIDSNSIKPNQLSKRVEALLAPYKGQELPKQEIENLLTLLNEGLFVNTSEGIKTDITKLLRTSATNGQEGFLIQEDFVENFIKLSEDSISARNKNEISSILVPSKEEFNSILNKYMPTNAKLENGAVLKAEEIALIRKDLQELLNTKIQNSNGIPKEFLNSKKNEILNNLSKHLKSEKSAFVSEESFKQIVDFAKILGEFKENQVSLKKVGHTLIEDENGTVLANSYGKFEKTLLDVLGIKSKDLRKVSESEAYAKELLDKKIAELCKDESRYKKAIEKLGDVISELEVKLNGKVENKSRLLDFINATENNYNNTAKRISKLGNFKETVNRLVKEDVKTLSTEFLTREQLFDFIDGIIESQYKTFGEWNNLSEEARLEYLRNNTKGVGSSKKMEITRFIERYQGAKNSLNRIIHTFDIYKRAEKPETFLKIFDSKNSEYINAIIKEAKDMMLYSTASEHTLKLNYVNNPNFYKDLIHSTHASEGGDYFSTKNKGFLDELTKQALSKNNTSAKGNVLDRMQYYITRFRNIVANSTVDFTKPNHILNPYVRKSYTMDSKTRTSLFNLVGQNPVEMVKNAAKKRYDTQRWVKKVGIIAGSITGVAIIAQFFFGKLSNPQNLKKQVNNDFNK